MTSSEFSVEGTASVKDEMGGWPERIWADEERVWWTGDYRGHMGPFVEYVRADLAAAPSGDQVSMGALRTTFHTFHDAVDAVKDELGDRGLLNGVYGDLHDEIGNAVVNRV